MALLDILKKKDKVSAPKSPTAQDTPVPEFTFLRSDTNSQDIIHPETFAVTPPATNPEEESSHLRPKGKLSQIMHPRSSHEGQESLKSPDASERPGTMRRLSKKLGSHRRPRNSTHVPQDLPEIAPVISGGEPGEEAQWEERATMLARENEKVMVRPVTPQSTSLSGSRDGEIGKVASKETDDNIQEAIRLHESGDLERSTSMFGRLADPAGENNALSQVLYGLALRHGWGCTPDVTKAVTYLSAAASNAATVESLALHAGLQKGGAAKGELVLAIFELANCFRNGWGVKADPVAAKQYYETAANLGDTDAMNEVAWCYLQGFGCKKDKATAAKYLRLAEKGGSKTLGNSWVWKEKYDPK